MLRRIWFFVVILVGLGLGLAYGWLINPVNINEPDSLRADYKTDYVLMVAEAYHQENDINRAVQRLAILGDTTPLASVQQAIVLAQQAGYSAQDKALMVQLSQVLETWTPVPQETP